METKLSSNVKYPFNKAINLGHSVDYRCKGCKDHDYARSLGYEVKGHSDCSYSCRELPGLSLSSYGDWGTLFADDANDSTMQFFNHLIDAGFITLWRITAYLLVEGEVVQHRYVEGEGWQRCINHKWEPCGDPFPATCNNCENKSHCSQSEYVKNNCYRLK